jgi:hypothetical protein
MADRKISDLTALTTPASGDFLPIVDISEAAAASKNKRITIEELMRGVPDGTAAAPGIAFETYPSTGVYSSGANQLAVATNGVQRLLIQSTGLTVNGTTTLNGTTLSLGAEGGANGFINTPESLYFNIDSNNNETGKAFIFAHNATDNTGAELFRIQDDGKVGVGTSTPSSTLDVNGSINFASSGIVGPTNLNLSTDTTQAYYFGLIRNDQFERFNGMKVYNNANGIGGTPASRIGFFTDLTGAIASTERLTITETGNVGIGTTSASTILHVASTAPYIRIQDTDSSTGVTAQGGFEMYDNDGDRLFYLANESSSSSDVSLFNIAGGALKFGTSGSERGQFDSSGRLLVGTATASSGEAQYSRFVVQGAGTNPGVNAHISLLRGQNLATTPVSAGVAVGLINFGDSAGNPFAFIEAETDGTTASGDYPGRLVFSTTSDSASSPTERMRITNSGAILLGCTAAPNPGAASTSNGWAINGTGAIAYVTSKIDNGPCGYFRRDGTDGGVFLFYKGSSPVGSISITAAATAYNTSSDYRLKENVTAVTDGITRLQQLKPSRFNFIADPDTRLTVSLLTKCRPLFLKQSLAKRMQSMMTATPSTKASTSPSWCPC